MPESTIVTWTAPECPFTIECSARTLDDIRLMITDAFFSLARGGLEIGGILLGTFNGTHISVLDYAPLECEHAYGPSFNISPNDRVRLRELLATTAIDHPGLQVVGWYHSHTRSGILLSEEDLELYNRYFPEPWQVAMVMKPHTFDPARIGFFFRNADGSIYAKESYQELTLEALPMRQIPPAGPPPAQSQPKPEPTRDRPLRRMSQVEVEVTAEAVVAEPVMATPTPVAAARATAAATAPAPVPPPAPIKLSPPPERPLEKAPEPKPEPVISERVPSFGQPLEEKKPSGRGRMVIWTMVAAAATLGLIFGVARTREMWMPKVTSAVNPPTSLPLPPPSMGLKATDRDGQIEIVWDRLSAGIREGSTARLEISDGGPSPRTIPLDPAHLQAGVFTYGRQSEKVDVKLVVRNAQGKEASEVATYVGKLPERKPPPETEEARKEREAMAAQAAKMKADLNFQAAKTRKLEKQLDELRQQQQKRMANQIEGK